MHFTVPLKGMQHCTSAILQYKLKKQITGTKEQSAFNTEASRVMSHSRGPSSILQATRSLGILPCHPARARMNMPVSVTDYTALRLQYVLDLYVNS